MQNQTFHRWVPWCWHPSLNRQEKTKRFFVLGTLGAIVRI
jgi:hypothetical protein